MSIPYGRRRDGLTFHRATRHTGATRLVEAGIDLRTVQELGNWKDVRMLERYAHPSEAHKQAVVETIAGTFRRTS